MANWNDNQPIFIQIRQLIINLILSGSAKPEQALPSIRQIATDLAVNPLTVTKAYQSLVELGVVEKKRGLGMFLTPDARGKLLAHERDKFLNEDWPLIVAQIKALELTLSDLMAKTNGKPSNANK